MPARLFDRVMTDAVRRPRPPLVAIPAAMAVIVGVAVLRAMVATSLLPYLLFIPAIIAVALLLGRAAGIVATLLAGIIAGYVFVSSFGAFAMSGAQIVATLIFVMVSLAIVLLCEEVRVSIASREIELGRLQAAHDALATNEAFMSSVLASSNDCIKVLDLDARITFMSEGGQRVMEVGDFNAIRGCPWPDFWQGTGNDDARRAIAAAQAGDEGRFQGRADTCQGNPKWWDVVVTPIPGPDGRPERLLSISRDISAMKATEERLDRADERLKLALGASGMVGIWDWDLTNDQIHADENFARIYAVDPQWAARGAPLTEYTRNFHPDDLPVFQAELARVLAGQEDFSCEYRINQPDGSVRWVLARGKMVRDDAGQPLRLPGATVDITVLKEAEQQQHLLNHELAHRLKNTMAIIQAIIAQTLRQATSVDSARDSLSARMVALGQAHDVLVRSKWDDADIAAVVEGALAPHHPGPDRLCARGPEVRLSARCALGLSLALHELATNATKYGALSVPDGRVDIIWSIDTGPGDGRFHFEWREVGGPVVKHPERRGFGSAMIERSLRSYFRGEAVIDFAPTGIVFRLDCNLRDLVAEERIGFPAAA